MTPTKIVLELTKTAIQTKVYATETLHGYFVRERVPFADGIEPKPETVSCMRRSAIRYAKRFNIPFKDLE